MAKRKQAAGIPAPDLSHLTKLGMQLVTLGKRLQCQAGLPMQPR